MPVIMLMIVDLPLPEGPTIATISASAIERFTPRNARYSSFPLRYTFSTCASSISFVPAAGGRRGTVRGAPLVLVGWADVENSFDRCRASRGRGVFASVVRRTRAAGYQVVGRRTGLAGFP